MGINISKERLQQCTSNDVARFVSELGEKYEEYATRIESSGIDGSFLTSLTQQTFEETLDCLQVTQRLHRRKLERKFQRLVLAVQQDNGSVGMTAESTTASDASSSNSSSLDRETFLSSNSLSHSSSSSHQQTPGPRRRHRKTPSDVPIDMVMECALAAHQIDTLTPAPTPKHVPAVLEAVIAAQALEKENLQQDVLHLELDRRRMDRPPQDGLVTIVLTDVENSTRLWEARPEAMREALALHDSLVRQLRERHHGYEIDTEGDAFFLAFSEPCDAVAFALDLQVALQEASWSEEILATPWAGDDGERRGLRVRVSVHMGMVETMKNPVTGRTEYDGDGMDVAQEVEKMTRGGQILTTIDTWSAAEFVADAKLGSPTVAEFNKPLVLTTSEQGSMDGSDHSQFYKRVVELTPRSMKRLSVKAKETSRTKARPQWLTRLRSQRLSLNSLFSDSKGAPADNAEWMAREFPPQERGVVRV